LINILMLGCGTRNKIVQYFKKSFSVKGKVVAADASPLAPALYDADSYYIVPKCAEEGYFDAILDICKKENIHGILSLIDPELSILSLHADELLQYGVRIIGSSYPVNETCLDKHKMYQWLTVHGYRCAKTYSSIQAFRSGLNAGEIYFPVIVKPVKGSASININKANNLETAEFLFSQNDGMIIQEFLDGQEIGADCYIDMLTGELVSAFTKKKLLMRAGETDKSVSFKDEKLFSLIERFVKEFGFFGPIDIDIFEVNGEYYISEVNPRFGGGYPHAYECRVDHMHMIHENLLGRANISVIGQYKDGVYMMKYNEVLIK
jgi:carbamoyl-phosphate synthase large subunit